MNEKKIQIKSTTRTVKDLKLNAILEITKAINNNISTSALLDLYQDILENRLKVGKLVLFSFDKEWTCILKYGINEHFNHIEFEEELLSITEIETMSFSHGNLSRSFEIVIPVYHKKIPLAYVLLGDVNEQKIELSAAIRHLPYIQTLTNIIVVAIENKKLYRQAIQKAQIQKELELAQTMQEMLFPHDLPDTDDLKVSAIYIAHQQVSGDYYDFIQLNNHEYIFCVADVSGKGIAAALLMSNIQATFHSLVNYTHNLKDILIELNKRVWNNANGEKFVSLFLGKINTKSRQLTYINAGHNPPILFSNGTVSQLNKGCTLLGIRDSIPFMDLGMLDLPQEFILFCYTDGLTDTLNSSGDYINEQTITDIVSRNSNAEPKFINEAVMYYAEEFKGENLFVDDIALLTIKCS
ncbi:MAG: PP2C family protein-serine/threonine phosphatase [Bacteroidia bacterium]